MSNDSMGFVGWVKERQRHRLTMSEEIPKNKTQMTNNNPKNQMTKHFCLGFLIWVLDIVCHLFIDFWNLYLRRVGQGATATQTHHERGNSKIESRNTKQIQNPKRRKGKIPYEFGIDWFCISCFEFVSNFVFRISDFATLWWVIVADAP